MYNEWALLETERFMEPCALQAVSLERGAGETTEGKVGAFVVRSLSWAEVLWFWVVELWFSMEELWFLMEELCLLMEGLCLLSRYWREGLWVSSWSLV